MCNVYECATKIDEFSQFFSLELPCELFYSVDICPHLDLFGSADTDLKSAELIDLLIILQLVLLHPQLVLSKRRFVQRLQRLLVITHQIENLSSVKYLRVVRTIKDKEKSEGTSAADEASRTFL